MTAFGHACGSICDVKQGPALSTKTTKRLHPYHICVSKVSTVTGIRRVAIAIPVIVIVCELSYLCGVSKVSTVTGIRRVAVAILVTVIVFELSYFCGMSKVSTVTGIRRVAVAILVTVVVFELSYLVGVSKVSTVTRMSVPPPSPKYMSHKTKKRALAWSVPTFCFKKRTQRNPSSGANVRKKRQPEPTLGKKNTSAAAGGTQAMTGQPTRGCQ